MIDLRERCLRDMEKRSGINVSNSKKLSNITEKCRHVGVTVKNSTINVIDNFLSKVKLYFMNVHLISTSVCGTTVSYFAWNKEQE